MKAYAMVWVNKSAKVKSVTLHLSGGGLTAGLDLTPEQAADLARELNAAVESLPRVAEASDLGIAA